MNNKKTRKNKVIKVIKLNSSLRKESKKHRSKVNYKNKKGNKKGGEAVAAGSYGCVFRPPIRCASGEEPKASHISKLMYNDKSVYKEKEEMDKVKEIIKKIPNNDKYFLVMDTNLCDPGKLSAEDLKYFDDKCDLFTENGINSNNVNNNLKDLKLITIPDGGIELHDYNDNMLLTNNEIEKYRLFIQVNTSLIELLNNGIVPINNSGLLHMDIKDNNILVDGSGQVRLIDWGLSCKNNGLTVPKEVTNHTIHFNNPFSNLFYNNYLKQWLPTEYAKIKASSKLYNSKSGQGELLKIIAVNMINHVIEYNKSSGHYQPIVSILHYIYKIYAIDNGYNTIDYNVLIQNTIIEYIQSVLLAYVDDDGNFKDVEYFYEVFSKNVDIWGFLSNYIYLIEKGIIYESDNTVTRLIHMDIINSVCRILIKYCYSPEYATKAINVSELSKELESLNTISRSIVKTKTKTKLKPKTKNNATPGIYNNKEIPSINSKNNNGFLVEDISM